METELDLSSVPDGLSIPGGQGLPAWYPEMELAYEKGLMATKPEPPPERTAPAPGDRPEPDGYFDQRYRERYAYYRKAMEVYLLQTLRLDVYDRQVEDSGLSFIPMTGHKIGEHQRRSVLELDHIFIQSSPHIERLGAEDIALLELLYQENGQSGTITQEALDLVERTYAELIRIYDIAAMAPYPENTRLIASSGTGWNPDSLVIVFVAPNRSDEGGNSIPEDIPLMYQREDWLVAELPKIRKQMMERVDVPVTLIVSKLPDSWAITFDEHVWQGASYYKPNPNRPAY
jgi:hypothetical protein